MKWIWVACSTATSSSVDRLESSRPAWSPWSYPASICKSIDPTHQSAQLFAWSALWTLRRQGIGVGGSLCWSRNQVWWRFHFQATCQSSCAVWWNDSLQSVWEAPPRPSRLEWKLQSSSFTCCTIRMPSQAIERPDPNFYHRERLGLDLKMAATVFWSPHPASLHWL